VRQHRRAFAHLGRELLDEAQHRRGADGGDEQPAGLGERRFRPRPVAGADQEADPAQGIGFTGGGSAVERGQLVGQLAAQPLAQAVAEQVVQAKRRLRPLQHRNEEAAPLDLLQPLRGRASPETAAQRPALSSPRTEQRSRNRRRSSGSSPSTSLTR
jgi:hypothetical protein